MLRQMLATPPYCMLATPSSSLIRHRFLSLPLDARLVTCRHISSADRLPDYYAVMPLIRHLLPPWRYRSRHYFH